MSSFHLNKTLRGNAFIRVVDQVVDDVTRAIFCGDIPASMVERIGEISGEAVATGNKEVMAACEGRLSRLKWRLERSGRIELALHGALRSSVSSLSAAAKVSGQAIGRSKPQKSVESRILDALLEGPKRPMALADEFGLHQSQLSRSLRSLYRRGSVVRINAPSWEPDPRGRWYALNILASNSSPDDRAVEF